MTTYGQCFDYIFAVDDNVKFIKGTDKVLYKAKEAYEYICDLLVNNNALIVHFSYSCLCNNTDDYKMQANIVGVTTEHKIINETYKKCESFVQCTTIGCNMPPEASSYVLSGKCV
jgi:hypothetical protein